MFKKILQSIANAGTVALVGYEIGMQRSTDEKREIKNTSETPKIIIESNSNHGELIIFGVIVVIIVLIAVLVHILRKKNRALV